MSTTRLAMSKVEDAVAADVPTLGAMHMNAFDDNNPEPLFIKSYAVAGWGNFVRRAAESAISGGNLQTRVGVIRDESGTAKAACVLMIARERDAVESLYSSWRDSWGEPHEGMVADRLDAFFGGMKTQHKAVMGHTPHIYLEIIMAHSTARGQGHGKALLLHANALADEMGMSLYLDADEDVVGLYERVGYVRQPDEVRVSKGLVPMVRAAV